MNLGFVKKLWTVPVSAFVRRVIAGQVRHLGTGLAGYLVGYGLLVESDTEVFVGILVQLALMIYSALDKKAEEMKRESE